MTDAFEVVLRRRRLVAVPGPDPSAPPTDTEAAVKRLEADLLDRGPHVNAALRRRLAELAATDLAAFGERLVAAVDRTSGWDGADFGPCDDLDEAARGLLTELLLRRTPLSPAELDDVSTLRAHLGPEDVLRWLPPSIPVRATRMAVFTGLLADEATAELARALLPTYLDAVTDDLD